MNVAHQSRHRRLALVIVGMALLLASCGIDNDSSPRIITDGNQSQLVDSSAKPSSNTGGSDRVFLIAPDSSNETRHLRAAPRDIGESAAQRLTSLFGGLSGVESGSRLTTAIPDGLQLRSASLQNDGTLVVDVSDDLLSLSSGALIDAVAQIVFTSAELPGVQRVDLLVDGQRQQWPTSDGELQTKALTVYDFPGFVESTQPDFPAVPSPEG